MPIERNLVRTVEPKPTWRYKIIRANGHLAAFRG
jgi:hypothetical protein